MPLSDYDKLGLLVDLLKSHSTNTFLSEDEQNQILRLTEQLQYSTQLDPQMLPIIEAIQASKKEYNMDEMNGWIHSLSGKLLQ